MSDVQAVDGWRLESAGIDLVPEHECKGRPVELFWVWLAANIGILGVVYGGIVTSFGLSFYQSLLAAAVGVASFALVGLTSIAGQRGRTSTLTLSRAIFGLRGNAAPTAFSWFNLMGWEAVNVVTGALTLSALCQSLGMAESRPLTAVCLFLFIGLTIVVSLLGQATVVWMQSWLSRIFGSMTLVVILYVATTANWGAILARPDGDWLTGFWPAVSVIAAGTGISWAIAGADYSRYQRSGASGGSIFGAVMVGASLPLMLLIFTGVLLSAQIPDLASAANPIAKIGAVLPAWMAVPYLLTATAGIVTMAVLSLYSASLNLLTIGVKVRQAQAVSINALIVLAIAAYVLFVSSDFLGPFIAFLLFCGVFLAAWEAVFVLDYLLLRHRQGYEAAALSGDGRQAFRGGPLLCWLLGAACGLLVSKTGFIDGPLAVGVFADSSLGLFVSFGTSLLAYGLYLLLKERRA